MCSYCSDVGGVQGRRDGPAWESLASSLGEGWELDSRRGEGRGIFRGSMEGGVTGRSGSTSLSVISVCCGLARERADRKAAEAGVAYWLLPRENPKKESQMDVRFPWAWLLAEWSAKLIPLTGPERGMERV